MYVVGLAVVHAGEFVEAGDGGGNGGFRVLALVGEAEDCVVKIFLLAG